MFLEKESHFVEPLLTTPASPLPLPIIQTMPAKAKKQVGTTDEPNVADLIPALKAQLNQAQRGGADLRHATVVRLQSWHLRHITLHSFKLALEHHARESYFRTTGW